MRVTKQMFRFFASLSKLSHSPGEKHHHILCILLIYARFKLYVIFTNFHNTIKVHRNFCCTKTDMFLSITNLSSVQTLRFCIKAQLWRNCEKWSWRENICAGEGKYCNKNQFIYWCFSQTRNIQVIKMEISLNM